VTSSSQRHRTRVLPYHYADEGLQFEIESYSVDGGKPRQFDRLPGQRRLDIAPGSRETPDTEETWDRATVFGRLTVPESVVEHVFPESEQDAPPANLYLAVRCHETIYRDRTVVEPAPTTAGKYDVTLRLDWEDVRGTVEVRPYLTRTEKTVGDSSRATAPYVRVADGPRYELVVDHWDDDDPPAIDGEEVSFSETPHLPDGGELYYLDFRNEARPKLWINGDHPRITDILRSEGSVGAKPRTRDVILDRIEYSVWNQLVVRAATAIGPNGDVDYEWQETVLEAFAPDLYDVHDVDEAKLRLRDDVETPEGMARLVTRLDTELQTYINPDEQLLSLVEEGLQI
jgi:hypothetical protein